MDTYFAARLGADLGDALRGIVTRYYSDGRVGEILSKQRLAYRYYYDLGLNWANWGDIGSTMRVERGGDEGERALIRINHWRSLVRGQVAMITNAKFEWKPKATSYDYEPMEATKRARYALDHFWKAEGLEALRIERVESASFLGEGFTHHEWDADRGEELAMQPTSGRIIRTGNIFATDVLPWDVVRDPWRPWNQQQWALVRFPLVNKHDLIARYPQQAESIIKCGKSPVAIFTPANNGTTIYQGDNDVEVWRFYHLPCASLPRGLDATVLSNGTVLGNLKDLAWGMFPLIRVCESNVKGSSYGYPSSWETLGIQELYDNLQSSVATNQTTFATQYMRAKPGVDPKPIALGGGLSIIVADKDDIEPMQLTKSPAEVFPHMDSLVKNMERLSGQTAVNRGEAQGDRQSGAALALLSAESIRNASPYQTSDVEAIRQQGRLVLRMLRRNATRPLKIGVATKGQPTLEMKIRGKDLGDVDGVEIELENPLQQTTEGRIALLQTLAQLKVPVTLDQAIEMIASGKSEPVTDAVTEEGLNILRENELLGKKKVPRALITDNHLRHCKEHLRVLSNPAARDQVGVIESVMAHVYQHYSLAYGVPNQMVPDPRTGQPQSTVTLDPLYRQRMMELAGVPMPQLAGMPMAGPTAPPAPGESRSTPPSAPGSQGDSANPPAPGQQSQTPQPANGAAAPVPPQENMPSMPTNKATGQRYNVANGGGTPQNGAQR